METKSRYQVIAELEDKKSNLIRERDGAKDVIQIQEAEILGIQRAIEDISVQKEDFNLAQTNKVAELEREKIDFQFKIKNTESIFNRNLEDANAKLKNFTAVEKEKTATLNELIKGVDSSLERFNKLQK